MLIFRKRMNHEDNILIVVCLMAMTSCLATARDHLPKQDRRVCFFAMNISSDAIGQPVKKRLRWAKRAGYTGSHEISIDNIEKNIEIYDAENMRLSAVYISVNPINYNLPENLDSTIEAMKEHKPLIWLTFYGAAPSTIDFDHETVAITRNIADIAAKYNMQVALYPHSNFYTEKIQDVLRVAKKVDRKNVGVTFNLCHFLKAEQGKDWKQALKQTGKKLFGVTICGADIDSEDWSTLIQPLDKGTFNIVGFLAYLDEMKFTGFIGVQDYGIAGDPGDTLKRSYNAYQRMIAEIKGY